MYDKKLKTFNEHFSNCDYGFTFAEASKKKKIVEEETRHTRGIQEIRVSIEPMCIDPKTGEQMYRVVNTSTYESEY